MLSFAGSPVHRDHRFQIEQARARADPFAPDDQQRDTADDEVLAESPHHKPTPSPNWNART